MKYHGNYCGPNWSDGKSQLSVWFGQPAVDNLDQLCKEHDATYALSNDPRVRQHADAIFAKRAMNLGWPKAVLAGIAVGGQAMLRAADNYINHQPTNKNKTMAKLTAYATPQPAQPARTYNDNQRRITPTMVKTKQVPAATAITSYTGKPRTTATKDGNVRLTHRGLVSGFTGSTTFVAQNFQVNPGLASIFPWASQLARSYDKYIFRKLKFEFRSVVPTTTAGVVMMSFDYDTLDSLPVSKFEHAQTTPNVESNSFNSFELKVQCDNTPRFVRQGAIPNVDLKTYDLGQLVISSSYGAAALVGEVYVDYEVELMKPSHGVPVMSRLAGVGNAATPFSTYVAEKAKASPVIVEAGQIKFVRPGEYLINTLVGGTGITAMAAPAFVGAVAAGSATATVVALTINAAQTTGLGAHKFRVGSGDIVTWDAKVTATTVSSLTLYITEAEYAAF
jgi:hypothetical protein